MKTTIAELGDWLYQNIENGKQEIKVFKSWKNAVESCSGDVDCNYLCEAMFIEHDDENDEVTSLENDEINENLRNADSGEWLYFQFGYGDGSYIQMRFPKSAVAEFDE